MEMTTIELETRLCLLENAVAALAHGMGLGPQLAVIEPEVEASLRAAGATDTAFRLRQLLLTGSTPAA